MYPNPLEFIGIEFVRSYGIMLALAFFFGIIWARKRAIHAGIPPEQVLNLSFITLPSSIIGARVFYVIYHLDEFSDNLLSIVNPFQGGNIGISGFSMMGGVVLALVSAIIYFRVKKINPWPLCDAMMPMFALGLGFVRIGCFLNGCCYGMPTNDDFGLVFPSNSSAGYHYPDIALIPTQLYSSIAGFVILGLVLVSEKYKRFNGYSFWITIFLYSIWRFIVDYFRSYEQSMIISPIFGYELTWNQILSLSLSVISVVSFILLFRKHKLKAKSFD